MSEHSESRRAFMRTAALLGGSAAASRIPDLLTGPGVAAADPYLVPQDAYVLAQPEHLIYSVCQQCNTQCGIKVKVWDGVVTKIEGNPYSPWNMMPHLPYATPAVQAVRENPAPRNG